MEQSWRGQGLVLGAALVVLVLSGAGKGKEPPSKVEETVGDLAVIRRNAEIPVEGVGLVVDLDDTGSDPEPSHYRNKLLDEMRKANVPNANAWLKSGRVSLVIVRGRVPTGIGPQDEFDVEVELTPASTTTSLAGGRLLETKLIQVGVTKDGVLDGQVLGAASGPVLTGTTADPNNLRAGRILGGARVKKEIPFGIVVNDNRRSVKAVKQIEGAVNLRFQRHEGVEQKGMAEAKNDQWLTLRVPEVYHQNQSRFFQVVQFLPTVDSGSLRAQRLRRWGQELLDPRTAGIAALRLEGIGKNACAVLQTGLASPDPQVRFFAAEALAYLDDGSGVDVLSRTAIERPEFRAQALAAMAASDQPAALLRLRELMSQPDIELRYGAFNALRTLDPRDPFLGRVRVRVEEPAPATLEDNMAISLPPPRRRAPRLEDPFHLYVVDCEGPPLVHVSRSRRCEIVVFGRGQKLLTPIVLGGAGTLLLNASDGDRRVQISRIGSVRAGEPDRKVSSPLELGEVVRELALLDATYPEILSLLQTAAKQRNLPGPLIVDAMPASVPDYDKAQLAGATPAKKDEAVGRTKLESPSSGRGLLDRLRGRNRKR